MSNTKITYPDAFQPKERRVLNGELVEGRWYRYRIGTSPWILFLRSGNTCILMTGARYPYSGQYGFLRDADKVFCESCELEEVSVDIHVRLDGGKG